MVRDPIRTTALEIVDDEGRVRARFGMAPDGASGLMSLWDADGNPASGRVAWPKRTGPARIR